MSWLKTWDNGVSTARLRNLEHEPEGRAEGWRGLGHKRHEISLVRWETSKGIHQTIITGLLCIARHSQRTEMQRDMTGHISVPLDLWAAGESS